MKINSLGLTTFLYKDLLNYSDKFKLQRPFVVNDAITRQATEGYLFEPTRQNFHYDQYLTDAKSRGIKMIWGSEGAFGYQALPGKLGKIAPLAVNSDPLNPFSWLDYGKAMFQVAARYGANPSVPLELINVYSGNDYQKNQPLRGLNLLFAIAGLNEFEFPNGWSNGWITLTPEMWAMGFSVMFDGHMGELGTNVGIRNADPEMNILVGAPMNSDINFSRRFYNEVARIRGSFPYYKVYDEFHHYFRNAQQTAGITPEDAGVPTIAQQRAQLCKDFNLAGYLYTEGGYATDNSKQQAPILQGFTKEESQGILIIRTHLIFCAFEKFAGSTFWHIRDAYDLPPYLAAGLNYKDWSAKPARTIIENFLSQYGDQEVTNFQQSNGVYSVQLSSGKTLAWSDLSNIGNITPMPSEVINNKIPITSQYVQSNNLILNGNYSLPVQ